MGETHRDIDCEAGYDDGFGEVLATFPDAEPRSVHPWSVWRDGRVRVLRRGKHFKAENAAGMRSTIYSYARRHDIAVKVRLGRPDSAASDGTAVFSQPERYLTVQFFPGEPYSKSGSQQPS